MKIKIQLLLCIGILISSCSQVTHLQTDDLTTKYSPTNPEQIEVYSTDQVNKNYLVIGEVIASSDAGTNASIPVKHLKKEAAKLGADAIINLKLEFGYGYWRIGIKANGTAIKFNN
ncbi:MAG: hypothetical protein ACJATA_001763 [Sphingobacteriales bacterium]|jgi:hypothetical protein